ncbi:DsbA family oxidoreductase [Longispora albida]|uniref:DsbA family oxidoreductase n=1 Tax=Longispora albida TaxID=203523 RepID=UPI00037D971A|nr:DsbA family oxidoreductase [Longispora albida]
MKVEIWADVICPWCGLGASRLREALGRFPHRDQVEVVHRSFQLDPSAPAGRTRPVREMLNAKGMPDRQIDQVTAHIEAMADAEGLQPYHVLDNIVGNTSLAHELMAYASEQGMHERAWQGMFEAYFGQARPVFDLEPLVALGVEWGLDEAGVREALTSRRYAAQVEADSREAHELGATGVPFVVIDRRLGIAGAQPVETILAALVQAWEQSRPALITVSGEPDGVCAPGGAC